MNYQSRYGQKPKQALDMPNWLLGSGPGLNLVLRPRAVELEGIAAQLVQNPQVLTCIPWSRNVDTRSLPENVMAAQLNNGRSRSFILGKSQDRHLAVIAPEVISATTPPVAAEILAWLHAEFSRNGKGLVVVVDSRAHADCLLSAGANRVFWQTDNGRLVPVPADGLQAACAALPGAAWVKAGEAVAVAPPAAVATPWGTLH